MMNNNRFGKILKYIILTVRNSKWKNERAAKNSAYKPTNIEQLANILTHGLWIIPAIIASNELISRSINFKKILAASIYGISLILLFLISTIFHYVFYCNCNEKLKNIFHRFDRAMIYIFIASSYFPWLYLDYNSYHFILDQLQSIIWVLVIIGILYQQIYHERFKCLETIIYLLIGIGPFVVVVMSGHEFKGMKELQIGGLFYIFGIGFFKLDGIIPCSHAIWHLFVGIGSFIHYFAVLNYLFPKI